MIRDKNRILTEYVSCSKFNRHPYICMYMLGINIDIDAERARFAFFEHK